MIFIMEWLGQAVLRWVAVLNRVKRVRDFASFFMMGLPFIS